MSENTELPSGGSIKANSAGLASVAVIGAALTFFVDIFDPSAQGLKDLLLAVRHAIPAASLGLYLCIAWLWLRWRPDSGEVINARKSINESIKDCDAILSSGDISSEFRAEVQSKKERLQIALIDSRAVKLN